MNTHKLSVSGIYPSKQFFYYKSVYETLNNDSVYGNNYFGNYTHIMAFSLNRNNLFVIQTTNSIPKFTNGFQLLAFNTKNTNIGI